MWQLTDYSLLLRLPHWLAAWLSALPLRWQSSIVLMSPCLLIALLLLLCSKRRLRRLIYPIRRLMKLCVIALMK